MTEARRGEFFSITGTLLWSLFPVITILSFSHLPPLISLAFGTLLAAVFFSLVLTLRRKWPEVRNSEALKDMIIGASIIGVVFYILFFFGLKFTSAGNASIIAKTEIFFSFLFFHVWHGEYISKKHIWGAALMVISAAVVLYPNITSVRTGDILILTAAAIAPLGNFFQRRARKRVSSETIMFVRSAVAAVGLFVLIVLLGEQINAGNLRQSWLVLLINGLIMLGLSKIFWLEAIHRISVVKANALSSMGPLATLFFAWLILHDAPTSWQLLSIVPMVFGVVLLGEEKNT